MDTQDDLLKILEANGQQFLSRFPKGREQKKLKARTAASDAETQDWEEWTGFNEVTSPTPSCSASDQESVNASSFEAPVVVEFKDLSTATSNASLNIRKEQIKAFMSSKVSKIRDEDTRNRSNGAIDDPEDDERNNAQNDALLYRLVHSKVLTETLGSETDARPAKRRKALAGRILEVSGKAKLGQGEQSVRQKERDRAAKYVRDGMVDKQKERQKQELEQAKNLGNYHPTLKKLMGPAATSGKRKREHGLRMGIGNFSGGMLRLSREDIGSVQGHSRNSGSRGRGRTKGTSKGRH